MTEPVKVWDIPVRVLHWTLAAALVLCWISTLGWGLSALHEPAGYVAGATVLTRLLWGFIGSRHARFTQFVRAPARLRAYVAALRAGNEPRYLGHNPLGGWMVLLLLALALCAAFSGWLFTTDRFWGVGWVARLHNAVAWVLLALVPPHVAGVIVTGRRHGENLPRAMFTGAKRAPRDHDVK